MSLANHTDVSQTITDFTATADGSYTISVLGDQSYILSLPDNLTHNITVSPGDNYSFNLPCSVNIFSTQFESCDISSTTIPTFATYD